MAQASQLSPELARGVLQLSRALLTATRNWMLYPPEHPAVGQSLDRLDEAIGQATSGAVLAIGVTPETLIIEGIAADQTQGAIAGAAAMLHDRDILRLTFVGDVPQESLGEFLKILVLDAAERRSHGGPAQMWAVAGHPSIVIEQIDYRRVLEREKQEDTPEAAKRDDVWRSIVMSISVDEHVTFDERAQQRLLSIAGCIGDIGELAAAVMAPKCAMDGSPMVTSQAATVLAAFRHLTSVVSVMAPERMPEVLGNLATAASQLDPHVVMQVMESQDDPADTVGVVQGMTVAFDDVKVAQLLATALALDGQASDRLATIFNTIAPDENRKRRVLTLTRQMLSETDFGRARQFQALWSSMEALLVSYNDKPFMSQAYRGSLDGVGARAERMVSLELPPELPEWVETLGQENVRTLSVTLLTDLLSLETNPERAAEIAQDMEALVQDLLLAGAYRDAAGVSRALAGRATTTDATGQEDCRVALDRLSESGPVRETVAIIGELDDEPWAHIRDLLQHIGPASVDVLAPLVMVEQDTLTSRRAADLIVGFGKPAVTRLAPLVSDSRWFVQRAAARLLGRIAVPEGVPRLQPLLRGSDPRVAREAVIGLAGIDDPSAARAIQTVLRAATGELRRAVINALVADRDPRVVPMLVRIVEESEPIGKDHDVVLETIEAMGSVGHDRAVPVIVKTIRRRGLFRRRRLRALKERGLTALSKIGGPRAAAAIDDARRTGDRLLRKIVAARRT